MILSLKNNETKENTKDGKNLDCVDPTKACISYDIRTFYTIDYISPTTYFYQRYSPNAFRYFPTNVCTSYSECVLSSGEFDAAKCLVVDLIKGQIKFWPTEVLYTFMVPSILDDKDLVFAKDDLRNEWISFCLNLENNYLKYNQGKKTCSNTTINKWDCWFSASVWQNRQEPQFCNYRFSPAYIFPFSQIDQAVLYSLCVNNIASFSNNKKNPFNPQIIMRLTLDLPVFDDEVTYINFYQLIFYTYYLLSQLFSISSKLLQGLDPGLPKDFIQYYFPLERQLYYYNLYINLIKNRSRNLGFGDRINSSNGDGAFIQIPNKIVYSNSF